MPRLEIVVMSFHQSVSATPSMEQGHDDCRCFLVTPHYRLIGVQAHPKVHPGYGQQRIHVSWPQRHSQLAAMGVVQPKTKKPRAMARLEIDTTTKCTNLMGGSFCSYYHQAVPHILYCLAEREVHKHALPRTSGWPDTKL